MRIPASAGSHKLGVNTPKVVWRAVYQERARGYPYTRPALTTATLHTADLQRVLDRYLDLLRTYRDDLNRLNVYPVPDGDTGTNMALTVESVVEAASDADQMPTLAAAIAHGSLMGAQGNSGIILSQVLRGFADVMGDLVAVGSRDLAAALRRAARAAYDAVGTPVEGTMLTVLRHAADEAEAAVEAADDLAAVVSRGYARAVESLAETPQLLPVLAEAGVVDAGGAGFLLLLTAFVEAVTGESPPVPTEFFATPRGIDRAAGGEVLDLDGPRYEVMFLLDAGDDGGPALREVWAGIGESIVVVGDAGGWNCHIHTDDIGGAVEAGIAIGTPHRIIVTDLFEQSAEAGFHDEPFEPLPAFAAAAIGVVPVAAGAGVLGLFRDAGAQGVVAGGQTMNPAVGTLLDVVDGVAADTVIVLPNNKNIVPAAEQLDALSRKRVHVIPTVTVPQGLAAMLAYQPGSDPERVINAMRAAADGCRSGELTVAVRDATTPEGAIAEGDWLGLVDGRVEIISGGAIEAMTSLLEAIVDEDTEVVTLVTGADADAAVVTAAEAWLGRHRAEVEFDVHEGGQPLYPYLLGAE